MSDYLEPSTRPKTDDDQLAPEEHCINAIRNVHAFLHGELPDATADEIREHLAACERCLDNFDAEAFISDMLRRCCQPVSAPDTLRMRITTMHIRWESDAEN